jgi:hypothetical protein
VSSLTGNIDIREHNSNMNCSFSSRGNLSDWNGSHGSGGGGLGSIDSGGGGLGASQASFLSLVQEECSSDDLGLVEEGSGRSRDVEQSWSIGPSSSSQCREPPEPVTDPNSSVPTRLDHVESVESASSFPSTPTKNFYKRFRDSYNNLDATSPHRREPTSVPNVVQCGGPHSPAHADNESISAAPPLPPPLDMERRSSLRDFRSLYYAEQNNDAEVLSHHSEESMGVESVQLLEHLVSLAATMEASSSTQSEASAQSSIHDLLVQSIQPVEAKAQEGESLRLARLRKESLKNTLNTALRVYEEVHGQDAAKDIFLQLTNSLNNNGIPQSVDCQSAESYVPLPKSSGRQSPLEIEEEEEEEEEDEPEPDVLALTRPVPHSLYQSTRSYDDSWAVPAFSDHMRFRGRASNHDSKDTLSLDISRDTLSVDVSRGNLSWDEHKADVSRADLSLNESKDCTSFAEPSVASQAAQSRSITPRYFQYRTSLQPKNQQFAVAGSAAYDNDSISSASHDDYGSAHDNVILTAAAIDPTQSRVTELRSMPECTTASLPLAPPSCVESSSNDDSVLSTDSSTHSAVVSTSSVDPSQWQDEEMKNMPAGPAARTSPEFSSTNAPGTLAARRYMQYRENLVNSIVAKLSTEGKLVDEKVDRALQQVILDAFPSDEPETQHQVQRYAARRYMQYRENLVNSIVAKLSTGGKLVDEKVDRALQQGILDAFPSDEPVTQQKVERYMEYQALLAKVSAMQSQHQLEDGSAAADITSTERAKSAAERIIHGVNDSLRTRTNCPEFMDVWQELESDRAHIEMKRQDSKRILKSTSMRDWSSTPSPIAKRDANVRAYSQTSMNKSSMRKPKPETVPAPGLSSSPPITIKPSIKKSALKKPKTETLSTQGSSPSAPATGANLETRTKRKSKPESLPTDVWSSTIPTTIDFQRTTAPNLDTDLESGQVVTTGDQYCAQDGAEDLECGNGAATTQVAVKRVGCVNSSELMRYGVLALLVILLPLIVGMIIIMGDAVNKQ